MPGAAPPRFARRANFSNNAASCACRRDSIRRGEHHLAQLVHHHKHLVHAAGGVSVPPRVLLVVREDGGALGRKVRLLVDERLASSCPTQNDALHDVPRDGTVVAVHHSRTRHLLFVNATLDVLVEAEIPNLGPRSGVDRRRPRQALDRGGADALEPQGLHHHIRLLVRDRLFRHVVRVPLAHELRHLFHHTGMERGA